MRWFRERECELIVLETGMGGRLDATTAVPADVCVITPIGLDHMQWLGDTLEAIAAEKAGIIVTGKPVISAPQEADVRLVLEKEANETRAPLEFVDRAVVRISDRAGRRSPAMERGARRGRPPPRRPAAQHRQRAPRPRQSCMARTLRADPPGVVLDGAHNPHSARVLAETWNSVFPGQKSRARVQRGGRQGHRRHSGNPRPLASRIFLCPVDTPRAVPAEELATCLPPDAPPHETFGSFQAAFAAAQAHGDTDPDRRFAVPRRRGARVSNGHALSTERAVMRPCGGQVHFPSGAI